MIETDVRLLHYSFAIWRVSSKIAGKIVTPSSFGALGFSDSDLFRLLIKNMLQPIKKIKMSAGKKRSTMMFLRLRVPFSVANFHT